MLIPFHSTDGALILGTRPGFIWSLSGVSQQRSLTKMEILLTVCTNNLLFPLKSSSTSCVQCDIGHAMPCAIKIRITIINQLSSAT